MRQARSLSLFFAVSSGAAFAALHGCSSDNSSVFTSNDGGDAGIVDSGPGFGGDAFNGPYNDFPPTPILDTADGGVSAPANSASLFSAGTAIDAGADAPCLVESEVGSLLPKNWLRPRFRWQAGGGENLFELRVHADNQLNDLLVYTTANSWTMPLAMWSSLAQNSAGSPMTVSVRGAVYNGSTISALSQGSSGPFGIAPAEAPGAIVYWHIIGSTDGELKGFNVGDENVQSTLPATSVSEYSTTCIGCHTSTPDGKFAVFASNVNPEALSYADGIGSVEGATVGAKPSFFSAAGQTAIENLSHGIMTTSAAHWSAGDYMVLASSRDDHSLTWFELDGTDALSATGTLPITSGDPNSDHVAPAWSHDGQHVAYISAPGSVDGRPSGTGNDIYVVPYNNRAGGAATALTSANTADNEYYPVYSPDDKWIAFNRTADVDTYSQPGAEVYITAADGSGTAQRLAANDPPACSGMQSPGVTNSWPKWAPAKPSPVTVNGLTYYWVVFSSKRYDGSTPQLYMAPVVIDASGNVQQFHAVYLWNQPDTEHNHTPAWDVFAIPIGPR